MTRLGYQIPNFTYPDTGPEGIFAKVVEQAKAAEASGFDRVFLMDHFYQLPGIGDPDDPMLECYTALAALSQHTESVRLSALVTGNTYRNPAVLAKTITTLDLVSGGRATLGIGSVGSKWSTTPSGSPSTAFPSVSRNSKKHCRSSGRCSRVNVRPSMERTTRSRTSSIPRRRFSTIPIMIGGSGEKKTLRMVAQYADESNLTCSVPEIPRKLDALAAHCERLGRDRSEIKVTKLVMMVIGNTHEEAMASLGAYAELHGWPAEVVDLMVPQLVIGDADGIGDQISEMVAAGLDGVTLNLATVGHNPDMVALAGQTASAAIG